MKKKVTIKDVALEAGVSHATVSMVFSGEQRISEETREKVFQVARRMNYVPNFAASNLRKGESNLIGFVLNDISNPVYGRMAQVAEATAVPLGYQVIIADHQWDPGGEASAIRKMIGFRARGLLVCSTEQSKTALDLLNEMGSPAVMALDNCPPGYRGAYIGCDAELLGRMAATHLLEIGCRDPLLFTGSYALREFSSFVSLKKGFVECLAENGVARADQRVIYSGLTIEEGREAFYRAHAQGVTVDGLLCVNDLCACGVLAAADELGLIVGKHLSLMGIGDHPSSSMPRISLTSIREPLEQIVRMAVEELVESFEQKRTPKMCLKLPPELVVRETTRPRTSLLPVASV